MPEEPKTVKVYARIRPTDSFAYQNISLAPDGKVSKNMLVLFDLLYRQWVTI